MEDVREDVVRFSLCLISVSNLSKNDPESRSATSGRRSVLLHWGPLLWNVRIEKGDLDGAKEEVDEKDK